MPEAVGTIKRPSSSSLNGSLEATKILKVCTVGKIYTPIFSFLGKELSILRFESWDRSQMEGLVILHSIGVL